MCSDDGLFTNVLASSIACQAGGAILAERNKITPISTVRVYCFAGMFIPYSSCQQYKRVQRRSPIPSAFSHYPSIYRTTNKESRRLSGKQWSQAGRISVRYEHWHYERNHIITTLLLPICNRSATSSCYLCHQIPGCKLRVCAIAAVTPHTTHGCDVSR